MDLDVSEGLLIAICFLANVLLSACVIRSAIKAAKARVTKWDSSSTIWFILTLGHFGVRQVEFWKSRSGYEEAQARIIIKYQALCSLGIVLAFALSGTSMMGYAAFTR